MASRTILPLLLAVAAVTGALTGCGSSSTRTVTVGGGRTGADAPPAGEQPSPRGRSGDRSIRAGDDPAADAATARRALLRLSDLPAGWSAGAPDSEPLGCPAFDAMLQRPKGISPTFGYGDSATIAEAVNVVPTTEDADAALDAMLAQASIDCLRVRSAQGMGGDVVDVTPLADAPVGDRSAGIRVEVATGGGGAEGNAYEDFVFLRADRGFAVVALLAQGTAPSDRLRAALAERAAQRLSAALQRE